jgi:hypothetical protein
MLGNTTVGEMVTVGRSNPVWGTGDRDEEEGPPWTLLLGWTTRLALL